MKKCNLIIGAMTLLMASCANDEVIKPVDPAGSDQTPMGFAVRKANQSRAGEVGLETKYLDFGVWAYKTNNKDGGIAAMGTTDPTTKVMDNYLVGFYGYEQDATNPANPVDVYWGYKPNGVLPPINTWHYAGLGSADGAKYATKDADFADNTSSNNLNQYLKYWDDSFEKTYFYAYTPYSTGVSITADATNNKVTFTFPNGDTSYMYAYAVANNTSHADVPLRFVATGSSLNVAFYNTIPGYDVEIIDYNDTPDVATPPAATVAGYAFVPSKATTDTTGITTYAPQTITEGGVPTVSFSIDNTTGAVTPSVSTTSATQSSAGFVWTGNAMAKGPISENSASPTAGSAKTIKAQNCECGFTLNVSFKLTAKDTKEVIYVRGARVHVPAAYCIWKENTNYTYKFRITTNLPGTTGAFNETDFDVNPNPLTALYPIVFEDVTITDQNTGGQETIMNVLTIDQTSVALTHDGTTGTTATLLAQVLGDITGGTYTWKWASSDTSVATVTADANDRSKATVTALKAGTAVVACQLTITGTSAEKYDGTYTANCAVTVTTPAP